MPYFQTIQTQIGEMFDCCIRQENPVTGYCPWMGDNDHTAGSFHGRHNRVYIRRINRNIVRTASINNAGKGRRPIRIDASSNQGIGNMRTTNSGLSPISDLGLNTLPTNGVITRNPVNHLMGSFQSSLPGAGKKLQSGLVFTVIEVSQNVNTGFPCFCRNFCSPNQGVLVRQRCSLGRLPTGSRIMISNCYSGQPFLPGLTYQLLRSASSIRINSMTMKIPLMLSHIIILS